MGDAEKIRLNNRHLIKLKVVFMVVSHLCVALYELGPRRDGTVRNEMGFKYLCSLPCFTGYFFYILLFHSYYFLGT